MGSDKVLDHLVDDFYDVLFKPREGLSRVIRDRTVWQGLFVYVAVSLVSFFTATGTSTADPTQLSAETGGMLSPEAIAQVLRSQPLVGVISILLFSPFLLFAWAAIVQFAAGLLGGRGQGVTLAAAVGYAQLPYLLVAPVGLVDSALQTNFTSLATFIAFVWSLFLKIEAVRLVNGFPRGRAAFAYFLPIIALAAAILVFTLLVGAVFMPILAEFFPA